MLVHTLFVSGLRLVFSPVRLAPLLPKINYIKILSHQPASFGNLFFHILFAACRKTLFSSSWG